MNHLVRLIFGHIDLWTALIALLCGALQVRRSGNIIRWSEATPALDRLLGHGSRGTLWIRNAYSVWPVHRRADRLAK